MTTLSDKEKKDIQKLINDVLNKTKINKGKLAIKLGCYVSTLYGWTSQPPKFYPNSEYQKKLKFILDDINMHDAYLNGKHKESE